MGHVRRQEWHKGVGLSVFIGLGNFIEFPGGSEDKASACHAGDPGSIPGLGRSLGRAEALGVAGLFPASMREEKTGCTNCNDTPSGPAASHPRHPWVTSQESA